MKIREKYVEVDNLVKATKRVLEVTDHNKASYHTFVFLKNQAGFRTISAPAEGLKEFQKLRLLQVYLKTKRPYYAHGFERGRNIYNTNARIHCGKKAYHEYRYQRFFPEL